MSDFFFCFAFCVDALFEGSGRFMRVVVQEGMEGSSRQLISPDRHMVAAGHWEEGVVLWVHEPVASNLSQRRGVGSDSERGRETPRAGTNADSRSSYPHVSASQGDVAAATECILNQPTRPSWLIGGELPGTRPEAIVNRRNESNHHQATYLFTPSAKSLDHLSIQSQRERRFGSIVRASGRVSRSIWSHDCVLNSFSTVGFVCVDQVKRVSEEWQFT